MVGRTGLLRFSGVNVERPDPLSGGSRLALSDFGCSVGPGEAVALIGHNGAGKSTALLVAGGLVAPIGEGKVTLEGAVVHEAARRRPHWLRARVGIALQFPERSFFQTRVGDEIGFTSRCLGYSRDRVEEGVRRALALVGLNGEILDRSPFGLSGGEKRKVALACAVAHNPSLLLLDEPDAGLDREGMASVRALISEYAASGGALLVATHDVAWALTWATRCIVLHEGRLATDIKVESVGDDVIAGALSDYLPDRGAWGRLVAGARRVGVRLPSPYRDEAAFLAALEKRLGGGAP